MPTDTQACKRAVMASHEVIMENCQDLEGTVEEIGKDAFAFVPESAKDEFDSDLNSPQTQKEIEEAVASCMESEWARDWATGVLGPEASQDAIEAAKRNACEGLFS